MHDNLESSDAEEVVAYFETSLYSAEITDWNKKSRLKA
jgi:hypothetical protein